MAQCAYSPIMAQDKQSRNKRHRPAKGRTQRAGKHETQTGSSSSLRLYGHHSVMAALANPARRVTRLYIEHKALDALKQQGAVPAGLPITLCDATEIAALVSPHAVTQGLVVDVEPLPQRRLDEFPPQPQGRSLIMVLDQVEDPQNVGAILRSCAVFGALCVITQDRHAPPETGALAKAASGALDLVPWVRITNIATALDQLAHMGYWRIGLAGDGEKVLDTSDLGLGDALVVVLGAEGRGLRPLTRKHCDLMVRIPMAQVPGPTDGLIDSLNVSNAAAVALYALSLPQK